MDANGFAFINVEELTTRPEDLLMSLGQPVEIEGVPRLQVLTPKESNNVSPNTYSGNYGMREFPLHTDLAHWYLPPRYLALGCIQGTESVGSLVYDSCKLIDVIGEQLLARAIVYPRRPIRNSLPLLRLLNRNIDNSLRFRFDSLFLKPANEFSLKALRAVKEHLLSCKPLRLMLNKPGDTILIDNWRMLHGRETVTASCQDRKVVRMYFSGLR